MGERPAFPFARYSIPVVAICFGLAWFALQQWLSTQPWWPALPWFEFFSVLSLFAVGVIFGLAYDDLQNSDSQFHKWRAARLAVADVRFVAASEVIDGVDWNTPRFLVRFARRVDAVQLEVTLTPYVQFRPLNPKEIIYKKPPADYAEGEDLRIPVAFIPREDGPHRSYWGEHPTKWVIGQTGNLIEFRAVQRGKVLQRYKVFISVGEGMAETKHRYHYLTEDRDIFGTKN